jgi:hypothetical protein
MPAAPLKEEEDDNPNMSLRNFVYFCRRDRTTT